jgi:hypothetical protein
MQSCARSKMTATVHSSVQPIEMPEKRFSHEHIDLVGPLPASSQGHTHLFTMVDRSTKWAEAIPLAGTTTADCVEAFLNGSVSRFGVPAVLTSDRGVQFTSAVWSGLCQRLGIHHKLTTAYHPQANWLGGVVSQAAEGGSMGETGEWRLVWPAPLDDDGAEGGPKGGLRPLFRGAGVWRAAYTPWRVPGGSGEAAARFHPAAEATDEWIRASSYEAAAATASLGRPLLSDAGPVRVHQERAGSLLSLTHLCGPLQGGGERPEVLPNGCRRSERGRVSG